MSTRREFYLEEVFSQLELLKQEGNPYGFVVKTVSWDAEHYENLDSRDVLPAIHIMHGSRGTKQEAGNSQGRAGMLDEITETFPVLIRGTVKGPQKNIDGGYKPGEQDVIAKSRQLVRLHAAVERVLSRNVLTALPGVVKTYLTEFAFPEVRESWGTGFAIIEFNLYIIHTYEGGTSP